MEFQVQKDLKAALLKVADQLRAKAGKHLLPHFKAAILRVDTVNKCQRIVTVIIVECHHHRRTCGGA